MHTILLVLISIFLVWILIVLIKLYHFLRPEELSAGDIVIVTNPYCEEKMMNMVTEVISVLSPDTVQLRGIGTTVSMSRKWVRRIDVNKRSSIKVPEKPLGAREDLGNRARFREIPLPWFSYDVPINST